MRMTVFETLSTRDFLYTYLKIIVASTGEVIYEGNCFKCPSNFINLDCKDIYVNAAAKITEVTVY